MQTFSGNKIFIILNYDSYGRGVFYTARISCKRVMLSAGRSRKPIFVGISRAKVRFGGEANVYI